MVAADPALIGQTISIWLPTSSDIDMFVKQQVDTTAPEDERRVKDSQVRWLDSLKASGDLELQFNTRFFTGADSREPELVGVWGGVVGSFYTLLVTLLVAFPLGIMAAIYLEEFAPKNRWTELIEVNINNLAAVPSIVYGLLGLAVFIGFFGMPRSAPFVGGLVLALMSLPVMIIAARAACAPCRRRSARPRSALAPRPCRWCCITCCRLRCPVSSPARSSRWHMRWVRPRHC